VLIYDQVQSLQIILPSQNSVTLLQLLLFIGRLLFLPLRYLLKTKIHMQYASIIV